MCIKILRRVYSYRNRKKINPNIEGKVSLKKFNKTTLEHYSKVYLATPALKEISTIILKDFDGITNQLSNCTITRS